MTKLCFSQCYSIDVNAVYDPDDYKTGTLISFLNDDRYSQKIPIGFPFCFYGKIYDTLLVSSNGFLSFDDSLAGTFSMGILGSFIHNPTPSVSNPMNAIMMARSDLDTGRVRYITNGVYPNRTFVVSFDSVPYWHSPGHCIGDLFTYTTQAKLYESDHRIEINIHHTTSFCTDASTGNSTLGLHNSNGTKSDVPYRIIFLGDTMIASGWNFSSAWSANDRTFLFTPAPCALCAGTSGIETGDYNEIEVQIFPNPVEDQVNIKVHNIQNDIHLTISNISGQTLLSQIYATGNILISLENWAPGIYFVNVSDGRNSKIAKLIKQ